MISKFFIERPVLSNVIAILMILIGGVCLFRLAVAQYPDVVPPTVQVTTRYPGASAKTVIDTVQKRSTAILLFVTLTSPKSTYDSLFLSNYATINIRDELSRLPGVGNVTVFGAGQYSMRVWLDPNKLQARDLVPQDVIQAIQQQSQQVSAGQVGAPPTP